MRKGDTAHEVNLHIINRVDRYRGLTSSATVMLGLKPFEETIYIDSVPVIEYKYGDFQKVSRISLVETPISINYYIIS